MSETGQTKRVESRIELGTSVERRHQRRLQQYQHHHYRIINHHHQQHRHHNRHRHSHHRHYHKTVVEGKPSGFSSNFFNPPLKSGRLTSIGGKITRIYASNTSTRGLSSHPIGGSTPLLKNSTPPNQALLTPPQGWCTMRYVCCLKD